VVFHFCCLSLSLVNYEISLMTSSAKSRPAVPLEQYYFREPQGLIFHKNSNDQEQCIMAAYYEYSKKQEECRRFYYHWCNKSAFYTQLLNTILLLASLKLEKFSCSHCCCCTLPLRHFSSLVLWVGTTLCASVVTMTSGGVHGIGKNRVVAHLRSTQR
jgi:hypothetical protein